MATLVSFAPLAIVPQRCYKKYPMSTVNPQRLLELRQIFTQSNMHKAWKGTVRRGLRRQTILDLHDYLDIHRNLGTMLPRVREDILTGTFRPTEPEIVTLEKKDGVSRRLGIPSPTDALVLQTLIDVLEPRVKSNQKFSNAYYSRSHDSPSLEDFHGTFGYPWWHLWPEFQKEIWGFARSSAFTVCTDIANYFDTIPLSQLRNTIAAFGGFQETVLDFLFYILEQFVWRPDYIPHSGVGLPQVNFDAPRLLAHAYLFPVDALLATSCAGRYVRWMDDIDFGVDSKPDGRRLLGQLEAVLSTRGLRLNVSKTAILTSAEAAKHFWILENIAVNILTNSSKNGSQSPSSVAHRLAVSKARFLKFMASPRMGQWPKLLKRYFMLFGRLGNDYLVSQVPDLLNSHPELREAIYRYYLRLGPSADRIAQVIHFVKSGYCEDEASVFGACTLMVDWPLHFTQAALIMDVAAHLLTGNVTPATFAAALWLMAKYATRRRLGAFILLNRRIWTRSNWAARQVAACYGVLTSQHRTLVREAIIAAGLLDALAVVSSVTSIAQMAYPDNQVKAYVLYPPEVGYPYTLSKFLVLETLLRGKLDNTAKKHLKSATLSFVADPLYLKRIAAL
jgi:hypothetical protein